jgi:elongator complex protein 1
MKNLICKSVYAEKVHLRRPFLSNTDSGIIIVNQDGDEVHFVQNSESLTVFKSESKLVMAHHQLESDSLVLCFENGDIATFKIGDEGAEIVGSFPSGIQAAEFSPDNELMVIVSGRTVSILNRDFYPVNEMSLDSSESGKDTLVQLGWGKKETQFHGSVGKAAALEKPLSSSEKCLISENDNFSAEISWRGDGEYFCCSVIAADERSRHIKVYDREGSLISTSVPVEGLHHVLSWRLVDEYCVNVDRVVI